MMVFWIAAAALLLLALLLMLPGLLRRGAVSPAAAPAPPSASRSNLAILRDQLVQVDAERAAGTLSDEQHRLSRREIERRVLDEEAVAEAPRKAGSARRTAIVVSVFIPVFAFGVYGLKGNLTALDPQARQARAEPGGEVTIGQVEEMVDKLAKKLEAQATAQPGDAQGWTMLARSYAYLQRFPEASRAYGRAITLEPRNAQLLADHADVLAALQGQQLGGEPMRLIEQALQIDPANPKALALAGSAAFERKAFPEAIAYWNKARQFVPPDSPFAKALDGSLAEARGALGRGTPPAADPGTPTTSNAATPAATATPGAAASPAPPASPATASRVATASTGTAAGTATQVAGKVSLAPALAARAAPTDTVFVFARAAEGPRMPLAIIKRTVADLPLSFTLDDSMAMSPQMKLSSFPSVVVGARISRSGNATPQPGDLQGVAAPVPVGSRGIELLIDSVQP